MLCLITTCPAMQVFNLHENQVYNTWNKRNDSCKLYMSKHEVLFMLAILCITFPAHKLSQFYPHHTPAIYSCNNAIPVKHVNLRSQICTTWYLIFALSMVTTHLLPIIQTHMNIQYATPCCPKLAILIRRAKPFALPCCCGLIWAVRLFHV